MFISSGVLLFQLRGISSVCPLMPTLHPLLALYLGSLSCICLLFLFLLKASYNIVVVLPCIDMNPPWVYMCSPSWTPLPPPSPSHPLGLPSAPALSTLSHASNLDWQSVSHMIIYVFQCYSLRSSHPCLLPQSPKDCSIQRHLCLFCGLAYRVIVTIFLNSIYALVYCIGVFLSDLLHSL